MVEGSCKTWLTFRDLQYHDFTAKKRFQLKFATSVHNTQHRELNRNNKNFLVPHRERGFMHLHTGKLPSALGSNYQYATCWML